MPYEVRDVDWQLRNHKNLLKETMINCSIDYEILEVLAKDHSGWRALFEKWLHFERGRFANKHAAKERGKVSATAAPNKLDEVSVCVPRRRLRSFSEDDSLLNSAL